MLTFNAKLWLRLIGALLGIVGVSGFLPIGVMLFYEPHQPAFIALAMITLIIALFLIYTCYLVWHRFSPRAVRYVCGNMAFFVFCVFNKLFLENINKPNFAWIPLLFLFLVFALYRVISRRLIRSLFKETA